MENKTTKFCYGECQKEKPVSEFGPSSSSSSGLQSWCKECSNKYSRLKVVYKDVGGVKFCRKCHKIKPKTEFSACSEYKDGLKCYCRECEGKLQPSEGKLRPSEPKPRDLRDCTDEELAAEWRRRGYEGELTKKQTLKI